MLTDTTRLALHTITTKPWSIEEAIEKYAASGVHGISVWKEAMEGRDWAVIGGRIRAAGLSIVSTVRGGFFPDPSGAERQRRIDDNKSLIEKSAMLGSPLLVLVCGAHPGQGLDVSLAHIEKGIEAILPCAQEYGVKLAVEPLHPMYADNRSAVVTLRQANDLCASIAHTSLGVAVDVYHLWWDPGLEHEIQRCGALGLLSAFHVCDWKTPTTDFLNDRGLMGEGCIDIPKIRGWVESAGFKGHIEVEIFSTRYWNIDQDEFLKMILKAYKEKV